MNVLVINSGSSSIKFQLIDMAGERVRAAGLIERIGEPLGAVSCTARPGSDRETAIERQETIGDHRAGMRLVHEVLNESRDGMPAGPGAIGAIGHRVVHGGEDFSAPVVIDDGVIEAISRNVPLAPLHNPANLDGITVARELFGDIPHVAVFDTAFHQTIPDRAHIYALPYEFYERQRVRRYGFHGTSHKYVFRECARLMGRDPSTLNLITVHLGNGCSITAIEGGRSIDTSLGMTPLEGLVMGTRCGDIDPAIHVYLQRSLGLDLEEIDRILNKESGLKGICTMNDMRDIHAAIAAGDERARLALDVQTYRTRKYIGAYMAVLGRVDGIVFTAGIGEHDAVVRERSLQGLERFGVKLDRNRNRRSGTGPFRISGNAGATEVWVVPTNEELAIARETIGVLGRAGAQI